MGIFSEHFKEIMSDLVKYDYKGFKLGEKKAIREHEATAGGHVQAIIDKLGADWKVVFDWTSFHEGCDDANKRMKFGELVYTKHLKGLANEITSAEFDDEIVEALNDAVDDNKTITIGLGAGQRGLLQGRRHLLHQGL